MPTRVCQCQRATCVHLRQAPQCERPVAGQGAVLLCALCFADVWEAMYGAHSAPAERS